MPLPCWVHRQKIEAPAAPRKFYFYLGRYEWSLVYECARVDTGLMRCQKPRKVEGLSNPSSRFSSPHHPRIQTSKASPFSALARRSPRIRFGLSYHVLYRSLEPLSSPANWEFGGHYTGTPSFLLVSYCKRCASWLSCLPEFVPTSEWDS